MKFSSSGPVPPIRHGISDTRSGPILGFEYLSWADYHLHPWLLSPKTRSDPPTRVGLPGRVAVNRYEHTQFFSHRERGQGPLP